MKKIIIAKSLCATSVVNAQTDSRKIIETVQAALQSWDSGRTFTDFLAEPLYDGSHNLIGKRYLSVGYPYLYQDLVINREDSTIKNVTIVYNKGTRNETVDLTFNNAEIENMSLKNTFDYKVKYNDGGIFFFSPDHTSVYSVTLSNGQVSRSIYARKRAPSSTTYVDKDYKIKYGDRNFVVDFTDYKPDSEKVRLKTITKTSKLDNYTYSVEYLDNGMSSASNGRKEIYQYDAQNRLVKTDIDATDLKETIILTYENDSSFENIKRVVHDNVKGKITTHITISKDMAKRNSNEPDYEWRNGSYELDSNNELVMESRDGKFRKKVNGVWTDWQFAPY